MANKYFKPVLRASLLLFLFYVVLFHHLFVTFEVKGIISVKGNKKRQGSVQKPTKTTLKEKVIQNKTFHDSQRIKSYLFVGIFSRISSKDRRNIIRKTWLKYCEISLKCAYKFLLDRNTQSDYPYAEKVTDLSIGESKSNNNDTILLKSFAGTNFGQRMYQLMDWLHKNYDFEYFLGLDDDHYVCLNKIMYELKGKDQKNLYWGKQICGKGIPIVNQGFLILSYDMITEFVQRSDSLQCDQSGSITIAIWVYELMKTIPVEIYGDNTRISSYNREKFNYRDEICHTFLSLHDLEEDEMVNIHDIAMNEQHQIYQQVDLKDMCPEKNDLTLNKTDIQSLIKRLPFCKDYLVDEKV